MSGQGRWVEGRWVLGRRVPAIGGIEARAAQMAGRLAARARVRVVQAVAAEGVDAVIEEDGVGDGAGDGIVRLSGPGLLRRWMTDARLRAAARGEG